MMTASIRQAQIVEFGIPAYQIRVWSELLGLGGKYGKQVKWRLYTPSEVFQISIMRLLKKNLNFAFTGREKYIAKLGTWQLFELALNAQRNRSNAFIVSDFKNTFEVTDSPDEITFSLSDTDFSLVIPTSPHIDFMLKVTSLSPNIEQSNFALSILEQNQHSPENIHKRTPHYRAPSSGRQKRKR